MKVGQRIVEIVIKGTDNTTGAFTNLQQKLGQIGKDVPALGAAFDLLKSPITLVTSAIVGMAAAIKRAGDENIRLGASFQDMANRTDMSVESLARWKFIAEQSGSSLEEFEQAFRKLRNTMADAATGNEAAIATFERLGVSPVDAEGNMRDLETVLLEIGQAVRDHGAASIQGAAAQDVLGRSSAGVVAIIKQESSAIHAQMIEAAAYSSAMTASWAAAADAADDASARLKAARENANAKNLGWWSRFKQEWDDGWADFILYNSNRKGWEELRAAEEESAKAAAHAVAVSYLDGLIGGLSNGPSSSNLDALKRQPLLDMAAMFKVPTTEKKWSEESGAFINVPRTADAIAADILKAQDEGAKKARESAALSRMAAEAAAAAPPIEIMSPEVSFKMEDAQKEKSKAAFDQLMKDILDIDLSNMNVIYGDPVEDKPKKMSAEMEKANAIAADLSSGLQEIGTTAVDAFLNGQAGAMKFGDMIKRTITRAIAEAIVKLLVMKAIAAVIGAKDGGMVAGKRALGGRIPGFAAGGYAVPDGPRGMDSRLIMAMPGEEVINRRLSQRLERFVTSYEMGAAVSPFALSGAGGGRGTVINFNVARPVNVLDALTLGRDAVTASRKYSEATL